MENIKTHFAIASLSILGCSTAQPHIDLAVVKNQYPIVLYVSNQSVGYIDSVNIVVKIDNRMIVNQAFYSGTDNNHSAFKFNLSTGEHRIVVESNNGNASMDKIIVVDKKKWFVLDYIGKDNFRFTVSDGPVGFV